MSITAETETAPAGSAVVTGEAMLCFVSFVSHSAENPLQPEGLLPTVLSQLQSVSTPCESGSIREDQLDEEAESPCVVTIGVDADHETTPLEIILGACVQRFEAEGATVAVVIKVSEIIRHPGGDYLVEVFDSNSYMGITVLIFIISVEPNPSINEGGTCESSPRWNSLHRLGNNALLHRLGNRDASILG